MGRSHDVRERPLRRKTVEVCRPRAYLTRKIDSRIIYRVMARIEL